MRSESNSKRATELEEDSTASEMSPFASFQIVVPKYSSSSGPTTVSFLSSCQALFEGLHQHQPTKWARSAVPEHASGLCFRSRQRKGHVEIRCANLPKDRFRTQRPRNKANALPIVVTFSSCPRSVTGFQPPISGIITAFQLARKAKPWQD